MLLEHDAAIGAGADDGLAVEQDLAAGRRQEAGNRIEQRGLAAARGAERDDEVAVVHLQVHRRQRLQHAALDGVVDREVSVQGGHNSPFL